MTCGRCDVRKVPREDGRGVTMLQIAVVDGASGIIGGEVHSLISACG
jgi:hypothetical protein